MLEYLQALPGAGAVSMADFGVYGHYRAGACNIGPQEIARRRRAGRCARRRWRRARIRGSSTTPSRVRSGRTPGPPRRRWLAVSLAACLLGMGTKEVMATCPLLVLLYDRTFVAGSFAGAWRRRRGYYLGLAGTWLVLAPQDDAAGYTFAARGLALLDDVLRRDPFIPSRAFWLFYQAIAFGQQGDHGTAVSKLRESLRLDPLDRHANDGAENHHPDTCHCGMNHVGKKAPRSKSRH